jgi:hypothetical protein
MAASQFRSDSRFNPENRPVDFGKMKHTQNAQAETPDKSANYGDLQGFFVKRARRGSLSDDFGSD